MIEIKNQSKDGLNLYKSILIPEFEEILERVPVIAYNESMIEVPGVVVFKSEKKNKFLTQVLNPGVEIIFVTTENFSDMLNAIKATESEYIGFESHIIPKKQIVLNLTELKRRAVFIKTYDDTLTVNDYVFTNSETEFQGDGMFSSKKAYFVDFETLSIIKSKLI